MSVSAPTLLPSSPLSDESAVVAMAAGARVETTENKETDRVMDDVDGHSYDDSSDTPSSIDTTLEPGKLMRIHSLLQLTKSGARREIVRLIGMILIVVASIVCIAQDVEKAFFTNIVSLIIGLLVKSPIDGQSQDSSSRIKGATAMLVRNGGNGTTSVFVKSKKNRPR